MPEVAAHGSRAPTSLAAFNRSLIQIAAGLSAVVQIAERVGSTTASDHARKALGHLEEGTFLIGVVGEFKRGKSTFINALLGQEILPADVLPATAVVSRIIYGRNASCTLTLSDGSGLPVPFTELANYVTKLTAQSAEQARSVTEAIVAFPAMILQNNIQIIDTPGLGDEAAMTERTMALLPTVDAAILVVSARSPFSSAEQALLRTLLQQLRVNRVFIVVNQIDLVASADVERVTNAIATRADAVAAESGSRGAIDVVPVSGLEGLDAKLERDHGLFTRSRFGGFEQMLEEYLARSKGFATLQRAANALALASEDLRNELRSQGQRAASVRERRIEILRTRIAGLAVLKEQTESLVAGAQPESDAVVAALKTIGTELCDRLRVRAGETAASTMDANWAASTLKDREAALHRAVHASVLPLIAECVDAALDEMRQWAKERLSRLIEVEATLSRLCAEPSSAPEAERLLSTAATEEQLFETLLPDLNRLPRLCGELHGERLQAIVGFPRRLEVPASFDAIGGIVTAVRWMKEPGDACAAGEPLVEIGNAQNMIQLKAPEDCRVAWIAPGTRAGTGLSLGPGAHLAILEPQLSFPINAATGGSVCALWCASFKFHLDWNPDRPSVEQKTTKQFAASAIGTAGWLLRSTNEGLKGFDRMRRTLEAGTSYLDRQLRAVTLANADAALQDEISRLGLRGLPGQVAAETVGALGPIMSERLSWIASQSMLKAEELRLRLEREMVLLEREAAEFEGLEGQVERMGEDARHKFQLSAGAPEPTLSGSLNHEPV